jgi:hypothetical protein
MAYHELLARVADNFYASRHFDDERPYEGLFQMSGRREIDPSLPPVDYRDFAERGETAGRTWRESPVMMASWPPGQIDFRLYRGDVTRFIEDQASEPTLDKMAAVVDDVGERWMVLDAYVSQGDPDADKLWRGLQQPFALESMFVPKGGADALLPLLPELRRTDHWDLVDTHGHSDCCYAGEIGWSPHACPHFHREFHEIEAAGRRWRIVASTETVAWEGSVLDCSIEETAMAVAPSSFVHARSSLTLDERGPSWLANGEVIATNYRIRTGDRGHAFLVRASWLGRFLGAHDLELLITGWHERWNVHERPRRGEPWENVYSAARLDSDLQLHFATPVRESREMG